MITDVLTQPDAVLDGTLRPGAFSEFTGQPKVKERLDIAVQAAKQRGDSLDHILLSGPPGLGKTTLAGILAREMGGELKVTSGPTIEKAADLAGLLTNLNKGDVLFIDEIHTLVGAGGGQGAMDAANILKPSLSRGELRCIGATTPSEYRKYIEKDRSLERRFQTIRIEQPTQTETIEIFSNKLDIRETMSSIKTTKAHNLSFYRLMELHNCNAGKVCCFL